MAEIGLVVKKTRKLETLLRDHYYAKGRGLHELTDDVKDRLPHDILPQLHYIATIRNKTVHEDGFKLKDKDKFLKACHICEKALYPRSKRLIKRLFWFLIIAMFVGAGIFYFHNWEQMRF